MPGTGGPGSGVVELVGVADKGTVEPYPHQLKAWKRLDTLAADHDPNRAGLLVLPTGSGKTFTVVHWLPRQMAANPQLRVLWMADQKELVEQAAREFERHAAAMPADFQRRLRVIHSGASPVSMLADNELDIACVTRQSLTSAKKFPALRLQLEAFLSRPIVVVIDEAHHAVAPTYRQLLDLVQQLAPRAILLGLTATPWPAGQGMTWLLNERFPQRLITVDPIRLMDDGVLARPVVYSVSTGQNVLLDASELDQIAHSDVPPSVLRRLDHDHRNNLIVSTWKQRADHWGKTLVFTGSIEHAEHLGACFTKADVRNVVLHSQAGTDAGTVLRAFKKPNEASVLISVGMLLEGVDLPTARTAILARPTVSRVVMRQMIGRVLRGPRCGGDAEANIIAVEDHWTDGIDILSPIDLRDVDRPFIAVDGTGSGDRLPPVRDELTGEPIAENILRRIQRAYTELIGKPTLSLTATTLAGYFMLSDVNVPVFAHARESWDELTEATITGQKLPFKTPVSLFGDLPIPRPTPADVHAVIDYIRSTDTEPPFIALQATFNLREIAERLLTQPAMTEAEKITWQRTQYESTLARSAYASFQAFAEALHQQVLAISGQIPSGTDPESPKTGANSKELPKIRRSPTRLIEPIFTVTLDAGRKLLEDAGEQEYRKILHYKPEVRWTRRPVRSTYAVWVPRISGTFKGTPVIRVSKTLQAPTTQIPDNLIQYLLWHELCHHVLPGHGHDAEFYRLLVMWPNFTDLDSELDTLPERYDLGWGKPAQP